METNSIAQVDGEIFYTVKLRIPYSIFLHNKEHDYFWKLVSGEYEPENGFGAWNFRLLSDRFPSDEEVIEREIVNKEYVSGIEGFLFSPSKVWNGNDIELSLIHI